jgi:hypothetical protein
VAETLTRDAERRFADVVEFHDPPRVTRLDPLLLQSGLLLDSRHDG